MTDEQIIKGYHACHMQGTNWCDECPYSGEYAENCESQLDTDIFELVKKQKAEIERLTNAYKQCAWERDTFLEESNSHIERIRGLTRVVYDKEISEAKAEAIKEFAELIKMEFYKEFDELIPSIMADRIDNLVKEMTEQSTMGQVK